MVLVNNEISRELSDILTQMRTIVEKILIIEDEKYEAIKEMNIEPLIALNEQEDELVFQIDSLETKRLNVIESLSMHYGFSIDIAVVALADFLPQETGQEILHLSKEIKSICERLGIITERNEYLLANSTEMITQILELVQGNTHDQYNQHGSSTESKKSQIHMLDQIV